ncbi:MAG: hypothetical protein K6T29_05960 [Peptococcaceae bacterium]|nr:hypothetical protein [Peptococcaceae bacterium]
MYKVKTILDVSVRIDQGAPMRNEIGQFVDDFRTAGDIEKKRLISQKPRVLKDEKINAFMAAVVEQLCLESGIKPPDWVYEKIYFLDRPWFTLPYKELRAIQLAESPAAFRVRNIFTDSTVLSRV